MIHILFKTMFFGLLVFADLTAEKLLVDKYLKAKEFTTWDKKTPFVEVHVQEPLFWREKTEIYQKVKEERLIPVSVKLDSESKPNRLVLKAGAWINVPIKETFEFAKVFENYSRVSSYVEKISTIQDQKLLYAKTKAYSYSAEFLIQHYESKLENKKSMLQWRIVEGLFKGMIVVFEFQDVGRRKTEISMTAIHKFDTLPLPKMFIEFGLEVIMQQAGAKLRSLVEEDFANPKNKIIDSVKN